MDNLEGKDENSPSTFNHKIIPIFYGISRNIVEYYSLLPRSLSYFQCIEVPKKLDLTPEEIDEFFKLLNKEK